MNTYKKYCPNVYVAQCEEAHQKGEVILVTTKHGTENECIVHNLILQRDGLYYYSITRNDGFDSRERAKRRLEQLKGWAQGAQQRSDDWFEKSNEGKEFLSLGEPIKVGHHSEQRHRALIERNHNRMGNGIKEMDKANNYINRMAYWEKQAERVDLSMPESLDFYEMQLCDAMEYHNGLKNGTIQREHDYTLTYANKRVKELKKKLEIAKKLWGE